MRTAIDKSENPYAYNELIDKRISYCREVTTGANPSAVFYDWGVERNINFLGFSEGGNSRFVDSLFSLI